MNMGLLIKLGLGWLVWKFFFSKPPASPATLRANAAVLYQQAQVIDPVQPAAAQMLRSQADGLIASAERLEGHR